MNRLSRQAVITVLAALAGLGAAVGLAVLTSDLSSQRIGLAGESPTAGRELVAPATTTTRTQPAKKRRPKRTTTTTVAPKPAPAPPAPAPTRTTDDPGGARDDSRTTEDRPDTEDDSAREPDHDLDD